MNIKVIEDFRTMSDKDLKETFQIYLAQYRNFARRGLLALYDKQTEEERRYPDHVHVHNGWGFWEQEQQLLSNISNQVLKGAELTERQYLILHELLPKYAGQLVKITRENQRKEDEASEKDYPTFYWIDLHIDGSKRRIWGSTLDLKLDIDSMPSSIFVRDVSGNNVIEFSDMHLDTEYVMDVDSDQESTIKVAIYGGNVMNKIWLLIIVHEEEKASESLEAMMQLAK